MVLTSIGYYLDGQGENQVSFLLSNYECVLTCIKKLMNLIKNFS